METLIPEISSLLNDSLSSEKALVSAATDGLDRLSREPQFPLSLLTIIRGLFSLSPFVFYWNESFFFVLVLMISSVLRSRSSLNL